MFGPIIQTVVWFWMVFNCICLVIAVHSWYCLLIPMKLNDKPHDRQTNRTCAVYGNCITSCSPSRSRWPRGLRRGSVSAWLLGLRVRIQPGACMSVSCDCCVLSGRGLCVGLITCPEEYYRVCCVWVWSWSLGNGRPTRSCRTVIKKV